MITCEKCGTQMLDNVTTCPGCGAEVAARPEQADEAQQPGATTTPLTPSIKTGEPRAEEKVSRGMSAATKAIIAAALAVVAAIGLIFWQARHANAYTALSSLTPEDMSLIADTSPSPMEELK